jgi:hypothetical protein
MKKRIMILAILAIITMGLAIQVSAQITYTDGSSSRGNLASNTNTSTAGIFKNDVDNFMNYHDYSKVLTGDSNWFSFVSGKGNMGGALDLGYASNFGGIYLGAWLRGNFFRSPNSTYETKIITPNYDPALEVLNSRTDTTSYDEAWYETANNIEFLIGIEGMGIKVGFFESTASNKNDGATGVGRAVSVTDYLDGRKDYINAIDQYSVSRSYLKPYLGWGGTFAVGDMTLYPYVDLGFVMYGDKRIDKYRDYTETNGVKSDESKYVGAGYNNGYMLPQGTIGAKIDLPKNGSTKTTLELSYGINLYMYSNDYSDTGLSGSVDGTVRWDDGYVNSENKYYDRTVTTTDLTLYINEITSMSHTVTPSYKITGEPGENFKLGFKASVPVTFGSSTSNQYNKQIIKTAVKYDWDYPGLVRDEEIINYTDNTETSTFGLRLNLNLGASYQLIPDRFGINVGIAAVPVQFSQTAVKTIPNSVSSITTVKETQDDGSVTTNTKTVVLDTSESDSVEVTEAWSQYTATLYGGFTFMFNSNAALDMGASVGGANSFNLDVTTVNVIFTFKY